MNPARPIVWTAQVAILQVFSDGFDYRLQEGEKKGSESKPSERGEEKEEWRDRLESSTTLDF